MGSGTVKAGTPVKAGEVIALSGNSGTSTAPHLHFEYAPNGTIYQRDGLVDPKPCVADLVEGAVSIRDNGSAADDAFLVTLNGATVCQTEIGASNNCSIGRLKAGNYALGVVVTIAPDNVGTYEVTINSDNMTINGGKSVSGAPPQGTVDMFDLLVK